MADPNYEEIAERCEARNSLHFKDTPHIMALLGYQTMNHGRLGIACRPVGESHWQSVPRFDSADDFELWVLNKRECSLDDIGVEADGRFYVSFSDNKTGGNEYGRSSRMGAAMWAAFIRVAAV